MKKVLLIATLLTVAAATVFAQGPVTGPYLLDHFANNTPPGVTYQFSAPRYPLGFTFREPQILTASTTIPASALTGISTPANCTITDVQLQNPGSTFFNVQIDFASGTGCVIAPFIIGTFTDGPATSAGTFTIGSNITFTITVSVDQWVRLVNFGANGTPLSSPVGDVCANIYVFDANQEMSACCSCRITPNGLKTLLVFNNLTSNPVTSVVPVNGDIKIVSTAATTSTCTPLTFNGGLTDSLVGFGTHVSATAIGAFVTETQLPAAALSGQEQSFLPQACQFARYLGSGKGACFCTVDDHIQ